MNLNLYMYFSKRTRVKKEDKKANRKAIRISRKEYISNLLDTDIMRLFYTNEDIREMKAKYKVIDNK